MKEESRKPSKSFLMLKFPIFLRILFLHNAKSHHHTKSFQILNYVVAKLNFSIS